MTTLVGIRRQLASLVSLTGRSSTRRPDLATKGRQSFSGLAAPNGNQNSWRSLSYQPLATSRCFSNDSSSATGSYWKNLSPRQLADLEDCISRQAAANIKDPILETNLASLQWIHPRIAVSDDGTLQILLKMPSLLHPKLDELKQAVKQACVLEIQKWQKTSQTDQMASLPNINVEALGTTPPVPMMARLVEDPDELLQSLGPGLATVAHTVAVYSCKGGVGKSTVAVNLAYELARRGGRVGLVDLDLYGPSLPVLIRPEDVAVRSSPKGPGMVYPIQHEGVSVLSLGFVAQQSGVPGSGQNNGAAVMKGPFAVKVVAQLLKGTDWGDLDVLLLDLPPGTGDVQLAVLQELQLSGAVAVTTPSKLAEVDTRKGIEMFTSLGVPTLAVVENMSYFEVDGVRHYPFGRGLVDEQGGKALESISQLVQLPISPLANTGNDDGSPICLERPENAEKELTAFGDLADIVSAELLKYQYGQREVDNIGSVFFDNESFDLSTVTLSKSPDGFFTARMFSDSGAVQRRVSPAKLRSRDPKTGDEILDSPFLEEASQDDNAGTEESVVTIHKTGRKKSPSLIPTKVDRRGRYGFQVEWGDGATIIYSLASIARAAGGTIEA